MEVQNNLFALRTKRGISVAKLAAAIGVSRQTIYAIESESCGESRIPNALVALKLADVLGVAVKELFWLEPGVRQSARTEEVEVLSKDWNPQTGQPVTLCSVDGHLVAVPPEPGTWSLPEADAVFAAHSGSANSPSKPMVEVLDDECVFDNRVLIAGCDPGASVLARHLRRLGVKLVVSYQNSSRSLQLLKQGVIHIAGTHIRDEKTGESNLSKISKIFGNDPVAVFSFALWEEGITVAPGNPKQIRAIDDLARDDVRIANREVGAGSRLLLDSLLARAAIGSDMVHGYDKIALGHLPSARQVQTGKADCCINTSASARVFGLDLVPLVSKRYDLVLYKKHLKLPQIEAVLDTLGHSAFRHELECLGGYDMNTAADRLL
jgi:molybdate-binding protein/DNA-binding XRE family transcriptional regulator